MAELKLSRRIKTLGMVFCTAMLLSAVSPATASMNPLLGTIEDSSLWSSYKSRFLKRNGRVVDNANKGISHSEGQGFAMVMAVAANDPDAFANIWDFTKTELGVRRDNLFAWRWSPRGLFRVRDKNNATDGDILIAWALLEASEAGFGDHYRKQGLKTLKSIKKLISHDSVFGNFIRPAWFGFSPKEQGGKQIINLSYWVFPALERLTVLTGDSGWSDLSASGVRLIQSASANAAGLPADWTAMHRNKGIVGTARKFPGKFSYNAIRVPLYLAWSEKGDFARLSAIQANWKNKLGKIRHVDVNKNRTKGVFSDRGYYAVAAVVDCSLFGSSFPSSLKKNLDKLYYPASLHILSVIAIKQRYPKCW